MSCKTITCFISNPKAFLVQSLDNKLKKRSTIDPKHIVSLSADKLKG